MEQILVGNPWTAKGRVFWKEDPKFQAFNQRLYNEMWTFEEVLNISTINNFQFKNPKQKIFDKMKIEWTKYITKWNKEEGINNSQRIKGFAALCYLFIVLAYEELDDIGKYFTNFEVNKINICYFYNTNGEYLPFVGIEELLHNGPMLPGAYQRWLDEKYERASWWISHIVYEKINNLEPIVDSPPAKLINK